MDNGLRRFTLRMALFTGIVALATLALGLLDTRKGTTSDYMAAIIDKHAMLERAEGPRVLLVGGSNLAFGVDSRAIAEATGRPVINLGLHAGLGLSFMLNELRAVMRAGDVVLICPEYFLEADGDDALIRATIRSFPPAAAYYRQGPIEGLEHFLLGRQRLFKRLITGDEPERITLLNTVYARSGFNAQGDMIAHLGRVDHVDLSGTEPLEYRYWEGIGAINDLGREAAERGVQVLCTFPCYPASVYQKDSIAIGLLGADLERDLDVRVAGRPQEMVLPDSLFFDTVYHLTAEGRDQRTRALIALLIPRMVRPQAM